MTRHYGAEGNVVQCMAAGPKYGCQTFRCDTARAPWRAIHLSYEDGPLSAVVVLSTKDIACDAPHIVVGSLRGPTFPLQDDNKEALVAFSQVVHQDVKPECFVRRAIDTGSKSTCRLRSQPDEQWDKHVIKTGASRVIRVQSGERLAGSARKKRLNRASRGSQ